MSSAIAGLMALLSSAASTVAAFEGNADDALGETKIQQAAEIISAAAPLVDSFSRGIEVSEADVREALVGMDDSLAAFDAAIAQQDTTGS